MEGGERERAALGLLNGPVLSLSPHRWDLQLPVSCQHVAAGLLQSWLLTLWVDTGGCSCPLALMRGGARGDFMPVSDCLVSRGL